MASFGPALRQAREQRGISIEDVARETRLAKRFLSALETESLKDLPGGAYDRAYLRTYAALLRLDAETLLREYEDEVARQTEAGLLTAGPDTEATLRQVAHLKQSSPGAADRLITIAVHGPVATGGIVLVAALVGLAWFSARDVPPPLPEPPVRVEQPALPSIVELSMTAPPSDAPPPVVFDAQPVRASAPAKPAPALVTEAVSASEDAPTPSPDGAEHLRVPESGVGTSVLDRELVGRSDTFDVGTRVVFWTLVSGGRAGEAIRHVWFHEGEAAGVVDLPLGGPSWRTQSRRLLSAEGLWAVEARTPDGRVLARHEFVGTF